MNKVIGSGVIATALLVLSARPAQAVITFHQLDQNTFTVSHRVKGFGSRGKAMELVYRKGASLCIAAGFSHYQLIDQQSQASQQYEAANATVTLRFYFEGGEDRIACQPGSEPEYIEEARAKLQKMGYAPPEAGSSSESTGEENGEEVESTGSCAQGCTIEQIAAMARAGLPDEKIRAACEGEGGAGHNEDGSEN